MPLLPLPKNFHPDFAIPGIKPASSAGIEVDRDNPLSKGLVGIWTLGNPTDLITKSGTSTNGNFVISEKGTAFNGGLTDYVSTGFFPELGDSIMIIAKLAPTPGSSDQRIMGPHDGSNHRFYLGWSETENIFIGYGDSFNSSVATGASTGDIATWLMTYDGTNAQVYYDGLSIVSFAAGFSGASTADVKINRREFVPNSDNDRWIDEDIYYVLIWKNTEITSEQALSLHRDPYQVLKPKTPPVYFTLGEVIAGWTGTINGVTDPARINGILVANIVKVNEVASS